MIDFFAIMLDIILVVALGLMTTDVPLLRTAYMIFGFYGAVSVLQEYIKLLQQGKKFKAVSSFSVIQFGIIATILLILVNNGTITPVESIEYLAYNGLFLLVVMCLVRDVKR